MSSNENIEITVDHSSSDMRTRVSYTTDMMTSLSPEIVAQVTDDFIRRTSERLCEEHYLEIVKELDMEAVSRLITLEVAKKVKF